MYRLFNVSIAQSQGKPALAYTVTAKDMHGGISKACKYANRNFGLDTYSVRDVGKVEFIGNMAGDKVVA